MGVVSWEGMGLVAIDLLRPNAAWHDALAVKANAREAWRGIPLDAMLALRVYGAPDTWIDCARHGKGLIFLLKYHTLKDKVRWNRPGPYGGPMKLDYRFRPETYETVPEALALIERVSAQLNRFVVTSVPLGDRRPPIVGLSGLSASVMRARLGIAAPPLPTVCRPQPEDSPART